MRLYLKILCVIALALPAAWAEESLISRLWATGENTRLVLESKTQLHYSVSDTENPPHLLLDIQTANAPLDAINQFADIEQPYIRTLHAEQRDPHTLRITFDLAAAIHYRIHRIPPIEQYQHRLVIDITPQTLPEDPLFALLESLQDKESINGKPFLVVVDPGHGGEDPGAVSPNKRYEKNLVLQISQQLADTLNAIPGMQAILTRNDDRFIPLFERVHIAHRLQADAFISIHADSVKSRKARGSSVFILSAKGASTPWARKMAQKANLSDLIGGQTASRSPLLDTALRQFSQDGKDRASRRLATLLLRNLQQVNTVHSPNVEAAGFAVLKSPSIPSVLVETAFISNPQEERKLIDKKFQQQLAKTLADALVQYRNNYHISN